jgi:uncharacterized membrane protein YphA (DoxX/SURF4 family)
MAEGRRGLRRFYPTFPGGLPGAGLLLLRAAIGTRLIVEASGCITETHALVAGMWAPCLLVFVMSLSFLAGFLTRPIGVLFAAAAAAIELFHPAWGQSIANLVDFNLVVIALAICLLGPGAFSLDAHFFGRRKIVIPRAAGS